MHDMFSSSGNGAVQTKKRKSEHYNVDNNNSNSSSNSNPTGDSSYVPHESVYGVTNFNQTDLNNASPSQQPFVRASTIKLLDTYQRCGQKVRAYANLFIFFIYVMCHFWF